MNNSCYLFDLIKTLTSSEKRHVTIRLNSKKTQLELIYFTYNRLKEFDNELALKQLKIANIDVKKAQLYRIILESLFIFNSSISSAQFEIHTSDILLNKKLYLQSYNLLQRHYKIVKIAEDYASMLLILERFLILSEYISEINNFEIIEQIESTIQVQNNFTQFTKQVIQLNQKLDTYFFLRENKDKAFLLDRFQYWEENFSSITKFSDSIKHELKRFQIPVLIYGSSCNWEKAYFYANLRFEVLKNTNIEIHDREFINAGYMLGTTSILTKRNVQLQSLLLLLKAKQKKLESAELSMYCQAKIIQIELVAFNYGFQQTNFDFEQIENFIEINYDFLQQNRLSLIAFDLGKAYLLEQKYRKAKKWFGKIEQRTNLKTEKNLDLYTYQKILFFICQIETGETEFIKQNVRLLKTQLKKHNVLYLAENEILTFISKKYIKFDQISNAAKEIELLNFEQTWQHLLTLENEKNCFYYFDFGAWIKAKMKIINAKD